MSESAHREVGMVGLADFVAGLRRELGEAQVARDPGTQFMVGPIELEVTLVAKKQADASAKVRLYVAELGGGGALSREETQRVRFTLTPVDGGGGDIRVSGSSPVRPR